MSRPQKGLLDQVVRLLGVSRQTAGEAEESLMTLVEDPSEAIRGAGLLCAQNSGIDRVQCPSLHNSKDVRGRKNDGGVAKSPWKKGAVGGVLGHFESARLLRVRA